MATTIREWNFGEFIRECYLRSNPSVDLNNVTSDNPIDCAKHRLSVEDYNKILQEFGIEDEQGNIINHDRLVGCNMWTLQSGPQLYHAEA